MKFKRIKIQNFLAIGNVDLGLEDRGLVLIQGENLDEPSAFSNGSSKSSIADALSWVLFGKTARDVSGDAVVNRTRKSDTSVELILEDQTSQYAIRRYRKHGVEKNRVTIHLLNGSDEQDLTGGTDKITQDAIESLIGCSYEVFSTAVYAGQEKFPDLPGMTDKFLKVLIEDASGIERLQRAYEIARSKFGDAKREFETAENHRFQAQSRVTMIESQIDEAKANAEKWIRDQEAAMLAAMDAALRKDAEAAGCVGSDDLTNLAKISDGLQKIHDKFAGFSKVNQELAELGERKKQAEFEAKAADDHFARTNLALGKCQHSIRNINAKIGTKCNECGKEYRAEDLDLAKKTSEANLESVNVEWGESDAKKRIALNCVVSASEAFTAFQATMPDVSKLNNLKARLEAQKHKIESAQRQMERLQLEANQQRQRAVEIENQVSPFVPMLASLKKQLADSRVNVATVEIELQKAQESMLLHKDAVDVFSPAGVRAQILDTVTPFLNDRTASYLGTLSDGNITANWQTLTKNAKGELREKFTIDVTSATGGDDFKSLSGGEKRKVRLATAMALADLVSSRAVKPINVKFYDEIDDAIDPAGLERLMTILNQKAKEQGTVFVVSHNDLSGWIGQTITVRKQNGVAELI